MTTQPGGIRQALRPWRRRAVNLAATWFVLVLASAALGLVPRAAHLALILLGGGAIVWYLVDHAAANRVTHWPLTERPDLGGRRGNDFRVTNLAGRLAAAEEEDEGREGLCADLHHQLTTIIGERLFAKHGITIEEEPQWARGVMPPELWDFVHAPPPPDLYSPAQLDRILRRIEQW